MKFHESKRRGAVLLFAALLVSVPFVGCGDSSAHQQQDRVVQVHVTDQELQMPESLPTGATTFEVTNTGTHEHSFGIVGPAGDQTLDAALKPGETATLDINLDEGTYRVYCPVDEKHGKPVELALHVTPSANAPAANASQS
jgi:predicted component of type VI protein secretion system